MKEGMIMKEGTIIVLKTKCKNGHFHLTVEVLQCVQVF